MPRPLAGAGHLAPTRARALACAVLLDAPSRLARTRAVVGRAHLLYYRLSRRRQACLVSAAWCHDLGSAPALRRYGLRHLDGALYLAERGQLRQASLVAHYGTGPTEARWAGKAHLLADLPPPDRAVTDLLTYLDLTTDPAGARVGFAAHMAQTALVCGPEHLSTRVLLADAPYLAAVLARTDTALSDAALSDTALSDTALSDTALCDTALCGTAWTGAVSGPDRAGPAPAPDRASVLRNRS